MSQYTGVAVSPGRVIGTIYSMAPPVAEPPAGDTIPEGADPATEAAHPRRGRRGAGHLEPPGRAGSGRGQEDPRGHRPDGR